MNRIILIAALLTAGCASPIVYKDPQTGHTAQCSGSRFSGLAIDKVDTSDCAAMLEHMGWIKE